MKFWSRKLQGNEWRNPWLKTNSLEASTAAWGLRAMLSERLVEEAVPVARYLLQAQSDLDPDVVKLYQAMLPTNYLIEYSNRNVIP